MTLVPELQTRTPRRSRLTWARIVTNVLSPPVVLVLVADYILLHNSVTIAELILLSGSYALFSIILPGLYVGWEVYRGAITDIHMPVRAERFLPFVLGIAGTLLSWFVLLALNAPEEMMLFDIYTIVYMVIITVITLFWKISVHTSVIAGAAAIVAILSGPWSGLVLLPLVILVGAARVNLKRHSLAQVTAGAILGATAANLIFLYFR